jgi:hypothetical protein
MIVNYFYRDRLIKERCRFSASSSGAKNRNMIRYAPKIWPDVLLQFSDITLLNSWFVLSPKRLLVACFGGQRVNGNGGISIFISLSLLITYHHLLFFGNYWALLSYDQISGSIISSESLLSPYLLAPLILYLLKGGLSRQPSLLWIYIEKNLVAIIANKCLSTDSTHKTVEARQSIAGQQLALKSSNNWSE